MIDDDDCDTEYPEPVDDQYITADGILRNGQSTPQLASIHVVRSTQSLMKLFRLPYITTDTLKAFDRHLEACMNLFPQSLLLSSTDALDPRTISPVIHLQNARLLLHRNNLSPSCPQELRLQAISMCANVSRDTSRLMFRCLGSPSTGTTAYDLAISASTLLCTHVWRCILFLLFQGDYASAMPLVKTLAAIGDARVVNVSCGRNISFFLGCIFERLRNGAVDGFEHDEELMAFVSGDLQSNPDSNWVWQGSETGSSLGNISGMKNVHQALEDLRGELSYNSILSDEEKINWGGWEQIERSLKFLLDQQHRQQGQSLSQAGWASSDASLSRPQPIPPILPGPPILPQPTQAQPKPGRGNSRMDISHIT